MLQEIHDDFDDEHSDTDELYSEMFDQDGSADDVLLDNPPESLPDFYIAKKRDPNMDVQLLEEHVENIQA